MFEYQPILCLLKKKSKTICRFFLWLLFAILILFHVWWEKGLLKKKKDNLEFKKSCVNINAVFVVDHLDRYFIRSLCNIFI